MPALFLDRDGVINIRPIGDYVKHPGEFIPVEGLGDTLRQLSGCFDPIIVVTNQAGIGKQLMSSADVEAVHTGLRELCRAAGGRIDAIYVCPHRKEEDCACRKPATGLAWQAQADFPELNLHEAWMVGDSISDMEFGRALGMRTVLIAGKEEEAERLKTMPVDFRFESLAAFARFIC